MATTLTILRTTPHSVILRINASDTNTVSLMQSGATGENKDLTSLQAGPLRTCLARSSNWTTLRDRIVFRQVNDSGPNNTTYVLPVITTVAGDVNLAISSNEFSFNALAAGLVAIVEVRLLHSNQR
jgi:hypothetical protein